MKLSRVAIGGGLAAVLTLAGCASGDAGTVGETGASSEPDAVVSIWLDDNVINPCFAEVVRSSWSDPSTELLIELKPEWDSLTKTAVAGGAGPDVIMTGGVSYTAEFAQAGALASLDEYAEIYNWADSFAPWSLAMGETGGSLYSLQAEMETVVLWYNKSLFDENGLTPPTTTSELDALAGKLDAIGIQPFASGNVDWQGVNEWLLSAIWSGHAGQEEVYKALNGDGSFTSAGITEATQLLTDWMQKGYIGGGLDRYYTTPIDDYLVQLSQGEAAMNIEGSWRFENIDDFFTEAGSEWDWVPFPTADGEPLFSIGTGSSWALNANGTNQAAGAAVLDHIFDPQTQARLVVECGMSPSPVSLSESDLAGLDERQSRLYTEVASAAEDGSYGYLTWAFWGPKSNTYLIEEIEKVWAGSLTVANYLAGLDAIYMQELESGNTPPLPER